MINSLRTPSTNPVMVILIIGTESDPHICNSLSWGERSNTSQNNNVCPISILSQDGPRYKRLFPLSPLGEDGRHELRDAVKEHKHLVTVRENGRLIIELVTTTNLIRSDDDWD